MQQKNTYLGLRKKKVKVIYLVTLTLVPKVLINLKLNNRFTSTKNYLKMQRIFSDLQ